MCGIYGFADYERKKNQMEVADILIKGLEKMEYRGYDSAGICIMNGKDTLYSKSVGRVENLNHKVKSSSQCCLDLSKKCIKHLNNDYIGIAHTRWATHGVSCEQNAHPVRSDVKGQFYVVHNGIITNYKQLKTMLTNAGHVFETQTDTEVASKLALYFYMENPSLTFVEICRKVMNMCEGGFAFIFISTLFPGSMIAAKQSAPLIIGISNNEDKKSFTYDKNQLFFEMNAAKDDKFIISSDITAILEHSRDVIHLMDGDLAHISKGTLKIYHHTDCKEPKERKMNTLNLNFNEALKGDYPHFMLKEIHEQKDSIINTIRNRVDFENKTVHLQSLASKINQISNAARYLFVACGTSYNSAFATKKVFEELTGSTVSVEIASQFLDNMPVISKNDVIFFISQSGETADLISALTYCKKNGAMCVGITNTPSSTISKETDCFLSVNAGIEKGVASTKAYTSQFMSIVLIAVYISQHKNTHQKRRETIIDAIEQLPPKIQKAINISVKKFVDQIDSQSSLILIGRGYQCATCIEGALKIKEISYVHSEGILAGELKHGSLALVTKDQNIIVIIPNDSFYDKSYSAFEQVQARGARPMVICTEDLQDRFENCIAVPSTIDCLQGLLVVIPLQMISYDLAIKRGYNPDFPRNLAKSVTVE
jgi:glutamine---fructose-6-phosphate transaminase (isomerizing)